MGRPSNALRGKVAIVMDATRDAGPLLAGALAQAGAAITLCGPEMGAVEALYQQFAAIPGVEVLGAACQGHRLDEVHMVAQQTIGRFGQIDLWINLPAARELVGPTHELASEALQALLDDHLLATFHGTQAALAQMLPRNSGKIINVMPHAATSPAHQATQAAMLRFTRAVAEEYRASGLSILALTVVQRQEPLEVGEMLVRLAGRETDGITGRHYQMGQPWWHPLRRWVGRER